MDEVNSIGNNRVVVRVCPPCFFTRTVFLEEHEQDPGKKHYRERSDSESTILTNVTSSIPPISPKDSQFSASESLHRNITTDCNFPELCVYSYSDRKEINLKEPPHEHFKEGKEKTTTFSFDGVFTSSFHESLIHNSEERIVRQQHEQEDIYR